MARNKKINLLTKAITEVGGPMQELFKEMEKEHAAFKSERLRAENAAAQDKLKAHHEKLNSVLKDDRLVVAKYCNMVLEYVQQGFLAQQAILQRVFDELDMLEEMINEQKENND